MLAPNSGESEPRLSDPATCGEDHLYNLSRATELAPLYCGACADYHVTTSANRLTGRSGWNRGARPALVAAVRDFLADAATRPAGPIDITIAATADTSVLATCAHAALVHGGDVFQRVRFTVLDRCRTPLELCRDFARRHRLNIEVVATDLTEGGPARETDFVVLHAFLPFLPRSLHLPLLRRCAGWLRPGGRLCLWNPIADPAGARHDSREVADEMRAIVEAGLRHGRLRLHEPPERLLARLDREAAAGRGGATRYWSVAELRALLDQVGLPIHAVESVESATENADGVPLKRLHVLAVLGPAASRSRG